MTNCSGSASGSTQPLSIQCLQSELRSLCVSSPPSIQTSPIHQPIGSSSPSPNSLTASPPPLSLQQNVLQMISEENINSSSGQLMSINMSTANNQHNDDNNNNNYDNSNTINYNQNLINSNNHNSNNIYTNNNFNSDYHNNINNDNSNHVNDNNCNINVDYGFQSCPPPPLPPHGQPSDYPSSLPASPLPFLGLTFTPPQSFRCSPVSSDKESSSSSSGQPYPQHGITSTATTLANAAAAAIKQFNLNAPSISVTDELGFSAHFPIIPPPQGFAHSGPCPMEPEICHLSQPNLDQSSPDDIDHHSYQPSHHLSSSGSPFNPKIQTTLPKLHRWKEGNSRQSSSPLVT